MDGLEEPLSSWNELSFPLAYCRSPRGEIIFADGNRILCYDGTGVRVLAGSIENGSVDGVASNARFNSIRGLCYSADGTTLYIADCRNHCIRALDNDGQIRVHAGTGMEGLRNGSLETAQFSFPSGLCLSSLGDLLIADTGNNMVRRIILESKEVVTLAGSGRDANQVGLGESASIRRPHSLYLDSEGNTAFFGSQFDDKTISYGHIDNQGLLSPQVAEFKFDTSQLLDIIPCHQIGSKLYVYIQLDLHPAGTIYLFNEIVGEEVMGTFPPTKSSRGQQIASDEPIWLQHQTQGFKYALHVILRFLDTIGGALTSKFANPSVSSLLAARRLLLADPSDSLVLFYYWLYPLGFDFPKLRSILVPPEMTFTELVCALSNRRPSSNHCLMYQGAVVDPNATVGSLISSTWTDANLTPPIFYFVPLTMKIVCNKDVLADSPTLTFSISDGFSTQKLLALLRPFSSPTSIIQIAHSWSPFQEFVVKWTWRVCNNLTFSVSCSELPEPIDMVLYSNWTWKDALVAIVAQAGLEEPSRFEVAPQHDSDNKPPPLDLKSYVGSLDGISDFKGICLRVRPPIQLRVTAFQAGSITIDALPSCIIRDFVDRLGPILKIDPLIQVLFWNGVQLEPEKRIDDYDFSDKETLHMLPRR